MEKNNGKKPILKKIPETDLNLNINKDSIVIQNTGDIFATDIKLSVTIKGGILDKINSEKEIAIDKLTEGEIKNFDFPSVFGLGNVEITTKAHAYNAGFEKKEADGFVFLSFIKINK